MTDAASEILGNECCRKKSWVTRDVLDLCDEEKQKQESIPAGEGSNPTETGSQLSRTGLGKCLIEEQEVLSRRTEYYSELYNHDSCGEKEVLDCSQPPEENLQPILHEEVEIGSSVTEKGEVCHI